MNDLNVRNFIKDHLDNIVLLNKAYKYNESDLCGAGGYILKGTVYEQLENVMIFTKTIYDLNYKIIYSIKKALTLSKSYIFNEDSISCSNETKTYYYIENSIYRIISLWDMLGQVLNIQYKLEEDYEKVNYKKILSKLEEKNILKNEVRSILNYIYEEIDYDDINIGNHQFVLQYRNKMTHRNSPNIFAFSNLDDEYKMSPLYIMQRLILECNEINNYLSHYTYELCKEITNEKNIFLSDEIMEKNAKVAKENSLKLINYKKKEIISEIHKYKRSNKFTIEEVLKLLNIDINEYNNFEKNNSLTIIPTLNKIIDFFKIETTLHYLIENYNE